MLIRGSTPERNPIHVSSVERASVRPHIFTHIRGSTRESGLTFVMCAVRASARGHIWYTTRESTPEGIYRTVRCDVSCRWSSRLPPLVSSFRTQKLQEIVTGKKLYQILFYGLNREVNFFINIRFYMKENWFSKYGQWLYQSFECPNSQDEHDRRILNFTGVYPEERAYK